MFYWFRRVPVDIYWSHQVAKSYYQFDVSYRNLRKLTGKGKNSLKTHWVKQ
jgi:hypothetical protein